MSTETDLRDALASLSLDDGHEPDVTDLRARIMASIEGADAPAADGEVLELHPDTGRRRARTTRRTVWLAAAAAAVVAALAAVAVVVLGTERPVSPAEQLKRFGIDAPFPGTRVVATYEGTGARTIRAPERTLPPHFEWTVYSRCTGTGRLVVDGSFSDDTRCRGLSGSSNPAFDGIVRVQAPQTLRWQVLLALTPALRTNGGVGAVQTDQDTTDATVGPATPINNLNVVAGRGTDEVRLDDRLRQPIQGGSGPASFQITLTCRDVGAAGLILEGVKIDDLGTGRTKVAPYTFTCFPGFEYDWNTATIAGSVRVRTDPGTSWTLQISGD